MALIVLEIVDLEMIQLMGYLFEKHLLFPIYLLQSFVKMHDMETDKNIWNFQLKTAKSREKWNEYSDILFGEEQLVHDLNLT